MVILDDLKQKVKDCEFQVKMERQAYLQEKAELKGTENLLRMAKKRFNQQYRYWKIAERNLKKAKSKLARFPSESRRWAKQNMNKVLEFK